ncbi:MAG TPA: hypothetical protein VNT79_02380, partial [Phycisphaerae bacterium]|nr:hypothetical protein [Phycisphaerae bacterium]
MSPSSSTTGSPAPAACSPMPPRRHRVGLIDPRSQPGPLVRRLFAADWCACERIALDNLHDFGVLNRFDAIVLCDVVGKPSGGEDDGLQSAHRQLELLRKRQIGVVVLTHRPWRFAGFDAGSVCLNPDSSFDMLRGSVTALAHIRPLILQLDLQYSAMQRLGKNLARRFEATNRELQLASQLQRDF